DPIHAISFTIIFLFGSPLTAKSHSRTFEASDEEAAFIVSDCFAFEAEFFADDAGAGEIFGGAKEFFCASDFGIEFIVDEDAGVEEVLSLSLRSGTS